jgi:hypothetical protein
MLLMLMLMLMMMVMMMVMMTVMMTVMTMVMMMVMTMAVRVDSRLISSLTFRPGMQIRPLTHGTTMVTQANRAILWYLSLYSCLQTTL